MMKPFSCCFLLFFCLVGFSLAQDTKPDAEGFVPLFNGKNLSGWEGDSNLWRVENGCIVGETAAEGPKKITKNTFLILKDKEFEDFELRFSYRLTKGGNSGVQVRSWELEDDGPYRVAGYQADFDGDNNYTGIVYGENYRGILAQRGQEAEIGEDHKSKMVKQFATNEELKEKIKVEDWNDYVIRAKGFRIENEINGSLMSVCTDNDKEQRRTSGIIAIQAHVGPPMKVEIKDFRIKVLPK